MRPFSKMNRSQRNRKVSQLTSEKNRISDSSRIFQGKKSSTTEDHYNSLSDSSEVEDKLLIKESEVEYTTPD